MALQIPSNVGDRFTVKALGAGSALSKWYDNSSFLVTIWDDIDERDYNYLIDCGTTVPKAWHRQCESVPLDGIILTHTHGDHCGGIEEIAFYYRYVLNKQLPIYTPSDVWELFWNKSMAASMQFSSKYPEEFFELHLDTFPKHFENALWISTIHISKSFPSYSMSFQFRDLVVLFSGDTVFRKSFFIEDWWKKHYGKELPDIILHEVQFYEDDPEPVHTLYSELNALDEKWKERIMLYHYNALTKNVMADGFMGYVLDYINKDCDVFRFWQRFNESSILYVDAGACPTLVCNNTIELDTDGWTNAIIRNGEYKTSPLVENSLDFERKRFT